MSIKPPESVPRVLHVTSALDPGGIETWLLRLARHTGDRSLIDTVLVLGHYDGLLAPQFRELGIEVKRISPDGNRLRFVCELIQFLKNTGTWDVMHSHVYARSALVHLASAYCGVPMRITHSHNDRPRRSLLSRAVLFPAELACRGAIRLLSHKLLACTGTAARSLFGIGPSFPNNCRTIPYGIDTEAFLESAQKDLATRRDLGIPEDRIVVGHIGRFMPQKNHEYLLQVAAEACKLNDKLHFLLVGDGPLRRDMEKLAGELNIVERLTFTGNRLDVPSLLLHCMDCFFFPSRWEGLGIVLLEAQLAGLPCYFSDRIPGEANVFPETNKTFVLRMPPRACAESLIAFIGATKRIAIQRKPRPLTVDYQIAHNALTLRAIYTRSRNVQASTAVRSPNHEQLV
jgi:glycosyltransferase involved in cell wall biosynthesis